MNKSNYDRYRANGATQNTSSNQNHTAVDPLIGWFSLADCARLNNQQKHGWKKGGLE